jgi:hypothetical protein
MPPPPTATPVTSTDTTVTPMRPTDATSTS